MLTQNASAYFSNNVHNRFTSDEASNDCVFVSTRFTKLFVLACMERGSRIISSCLAVRAVICIKSKPFEYI